jgi:hypothetical protein
VEHRKRYPSGEGAVGIGSSVGCHAALDSTQIPLEPSRQSELFGKKTGMSKALEELTAEWELGDKS